jgi:hypothetical protein
MHLFLHHNKRCVDRACFVSIRNDCSSLSDCEIKLRLCFLFRVWAYCPKRGLSIRLNFIFEYTICRKTGFFIHREEERNQTQTEFSFFLRQKLEPKYRDRIHVEFFLFIKQISKPTTFLLYELAEHLFILEISLYPRVSL